MIEMKDSKEKVIGGDVPAVAPVSENKIREIGNSMIGAASINSETNINIGPSNIE